MVMVYVVTIGSQMRQDHGVEAVFSTMALARKFARDAKTADGETRSIEAFELDGRAAAAISGAGKPRRSNSQ